MSITTKGLFFLILGPSGIGKGTTIAMLKERHPEWYYPISCTTRAPRPGEEDGVVYHFISEEEFLRRQGEGAFLEAAQIHGIQYTGLLKAPVLEALEAGKTVVREINYEGYESIMASEVAPYVVSLFITTTDVDGLMERITQRSALDPVEVEKRLASARTELSGQDRYDYVIPTVEGDPEAVYAQVEKCMLERINEIPPLSSQ